MKLFNKYFGVLGIGLVLILGSCEKNFLDVNVSPNNPTSVTPDLLLPGALNSVASEVNNTFNTLGNLWTGSWGQAPDFLFYVNQEHYTLTPNSYNTDWQNLYATALINLQKVIEQSNDKQKNYVAIAKIMQAYTFQLITDLWGDAPYTDALQGTGNVAPKYMPAEQTYDSILVLLDDGLNTIDTDPTQLRPGQSDIVFGLTDDRKGVRSLNDAMTLWKQFGNTLKLRILMRQTLVSGRAAKVQAGFSSLANAQFLGAGRNAGANPGYINQAGKMNPLYGTIGFSVTGGVTNSNSATRANNFAVTFLNNTNDPRLTRIYRPVTGTSNYKGVIAGSTAGPGNRSADLSPVGDQIVKVNGFSEPAYLITASESFFLQAEAQVRHLLPGDPAQSYQAGIQESFKLLGSTAAAATTYYTSATDKRVNFSLALTDEQKIEAIITQKWVALNGFNGIEAWNEWRRTGYPTGIPMTLNPGTAKFPVRLPYAQDELNSNPNVPVISNIFDTKIFWDTN